MAPTKKTRKTKRLQDRAVRTAKKQKGQQKQEPGPSSISYAPLPPAGAPATAAAAATTVTAAVVWPSPPPTSTLGAVCIAAHPPSPTPCTRAPGPPLPASASRGRLSVSLRTPSAVEFEATVGGESGGKDEGAETLPRPAAGLAAAPTEPPFSSVATTTSPLTPAPAPLPTPFSSPPPRESRIRGAFCCCCCCLPPASEPLPDERTPGDSAAPPPPPPPFASNATTAPTAPTAAPAAAAAAAVSDLAAPGDLRGDRLVPPVAGVKPTAGDFSASSVEKVTRYGVSGCPSSHLVLTSSSHSAHLIRGFHKKKKRDYIYVYTGISV